MSYCGRKPIYESLLVLECEHKEIGNSMTTWYRYCNKCKKLMKVKYQYHVSEFGDHLTRYE